MKKLILVNSHAGHTLEYANLLKDELKDCDIVEYKKFKKKMLNDYDYLIYMGWVRSSVIQGLDIMLKHYEVFGPIKKCVIAVGMMPFHPLMVDNLKMMNNIEKSPLFYLQGGVDTTKLGFINKKMLSVMVGTLLSRKKAGQITAEEQATLDILSDPKNYVCKENIYPIADYINTIDETGNPPAEVIVSNEENKTVSTEAEVVDAEIVE